MKTSIISSIIISLVILLSSELKAQNPIPSFNVPVVADPTTFEEQSSDNSNQNLISIKNQALKSFIKGVKTEKTINVKTKDKNQNTTAFSDFFLYAIGTEIELGPFSCYEGTTFEQSLDPSFIWGLRVADASSDCEMDVWFD